MFFEILAVLFWLVGLLCGIYILIAAFSDELWKGIVCLLCGIYMLYFAIVEFDSPNKWLVIAGWIFASGIGSALYSLGAGGLHPNHY